MEEEKIICITTQADRTYYLAKQVAKEFIDRDQNVVHTTGTLPDGKITEISTTSATFKTLQGGKLHGKLEVVNLVDGTVSFSEEYENGVLRTIHENSSAQKDGPKTAPIHEGTTLKTSKGAHAFYLNGKEIAEETIASNGASLELLGNIPDGEVKEFNENNQLITLAHYKDNKLNGELIRYTTRGEELSREEYMDGFLHGKATYITFEQNDTLTAVCEYRNSRLHGERTVTQQNGTLRCREFYKNGRLHGPRVCYYANGTKEREENYTEGKLNGKRELFFAQGPLWYRENYANGRLDGAREGFFPDGTKYLEEFYSEGMLEGQRNLYAQDGSLLTSEQYHWGTLQHNPEGNKE
ncbi:MAG: hypothetical protein MJ053_02115 [Elusimicrobiaceae bacterium]|nr:hypothetical protein [Elusimicrobiaceae bacterium]